jgi:hypothetical protein
MNKRWVAWGCWGISPFLAAVACSGKNVNDVGDIDSGGHAGASPLQSSAGDGAGAAGAPDRMANPSGGGDAGSMNIPEAGSAGGGAAGTPDVVETPGRAGGDGGVVFECPTCTVVADEQDVRGVTVSGNRVYWVVDGKYDVLGNYDYDGRLFARDVSGGSQSLIVDGLPGPEEVSVNGDYAYVFVDHRAQQSFPQGLLRIPLAGGAPVEVSTSTVNDVVTLPLSAAPGYEYWVLNGGLARTANLANAAKEAVLDPRGVEQVTNDGTTLFFRDAKGLWTIPLAGGDPVQIYAYLDSLYPDSFDLSVAGDYLYSLGAPSHYSDDQNYYLVRMPKTGGVWTRLAIVAGNTSALAVDGERLFMGSYPASGDRFNLYQSTLTAPEPSTLLLTYTASRSWSWAISSTGVFYGDDHALYFTPGAL